MKTAKEWDQDIMRITMKIHQEFPELSKYIKEIPVQFPEEHKDGRDTKSLEDYYNSLVALVEGYSQSHPQEAKHTTDKD